MADETFLKLCNRLKTDEKILMKYTSKLEMTVCELKNCSKCRSIDKCKNEIQGHVYYPNVRNERIEFFYKPCKHFKETQNKNKTVFFETPIKGQIPRNLTKIKFSTKIAAKDNDTISVKLISISPFFH